MKKIKLAIVGVTGLVGQTIIDVLKEEGMMGLVELHLFASNKSAGKRILFMDNEYEIKKLDDAVLKENFDYAIFSAGSLVSKIWVKKFASRGTVVIDNTSFFRKKNDIPLIVPEINQFRINKTHKIISNPNCSTIQLALVLDRLRNLSRIKQVVVSTYQSVSGAGRRAVSDLANHTKNVFEKGINNNVVAGIGKQDKNGFFEEEQKLMFETNKILEDDSIQIHATAVRVPISHCHAESVYVRFENGVDKKRFFKALCCDYIVTSKNEIFYPTEVFKSNKTYVCRVRKVSRKEYLFFVIADNLRRGAAYNAVEILKYLIEINGN